jgi:hypothetical protein
MRWNVDSGLNTEKNLKTVGGFQRITGFFHASMDLWGGNVED